MDREHHAFEVLPGGTQIWRATATGHEDAVKKLKEVAKDTTDENTIWVTEVWDTTASHEASLSLPAVKNAIPWAKAIVSNFEKIAVTSPVWGARLPTA